jgi:beta-glucosidase
MKIGGSLGSVAAALLAVTSVAVATSTTTSVSAAPSRAELNVSASPLDRANVLVARMTLDEKIAMVHGAGYPLPLNAAGYAGVVPGNSRLGIPALYLADSPVGVGNGSTGVTQWPDTSALAASWSTSLAGQYGAAYGAEQAGKGHNVALAPTVNILRLPIWGRAPETFSEDPYLTAQDATAEIRGIQSKHVIATVKHFVANNQEIQRSWINVVASERTRAEIYQPAFRAAITQGQVGAVMCSYNRVGGTYACQNGDELTGVLRDAYHFDGFVMSDWGALHSTAPAANAGLDMEMPGAADDANLRPIDQLFGSFFNSRLKAAVRSGAVSMGTLDAMVRHILTAMFRIGLFDHPLPAPASVKDNVVSTPEHQRLATSLAEAGTVLLKNPGGLLPLDPKALRSIAVIGDAAQEHPQTAAGGSATVLPSMPVVTALAGIRARTAGTRITVTHAQGTLGTTLGTLDATGHANDAVPAGAFGAGLTAKYYRNADLTGSPLATEVVPSLDFPGVPAAVANRPVWSATYDGTITAPATGDYRFTLSAGALVTVWIDGKRTVSFVPEREPIRNGLLHLSAGPHRLHVQVTPYQVKLVGVDTFALIPGLHLGWQPQENRLVAAAANTARAADVAVVVVSDVASEGMDRSTLALPADQDKLIAAVAGANPRTIVVLNTSGAVLMPWLDKVAAVLEAWYPGQTGGTALAHVLFGDANPSGKLPVTFPRSDAQGPARTTLQYPGNGNDVHYDEGLLVGYRWYDGSGQHPLFPFGYGLSYTSFRFSDLDVHAQAAHNWTVTATVTNTGKRTGAEVAELYLSFPSSTGEPPKQLKGFQRVTLRANESRQVSFGLTGDSVSIWSSGAWRARPGEYRVLVGDSSRNLPLHGSLTVR